MLLHIYLTLFTLLIGFHDCPIVEQFKIVYDIIALATQFAEECELPLGDIARNQGNSNDAVAEAIFGNDNDDYWEIPLNVWLVNRILRKRIICQSEVISQGVYTAFILFKYYFSNM